jgi:hypothetical protein
MIVCCAFIHSRIPGFWDLGIVYLCFQFLGIPFEFLIYYGAKFRNRWFLGLWLFIGYMDFMGAVLIGIMSFFSTRSILFDISFFFRSISRINSGAKVIGGAIWFNLQWWMYMVVWAAFLDIGREDEETERVRYNALLDEEDEANEAAKFKDPEKDGNDSAYASKVASATSERSSRSTKKSGLDGIEYVPAIAAGGLAGAGVGLLAGDALNGSQGSTLSSNMDKEDALSVHTVNLFEESGGYPSEPPPAYSYEEPESDKPMSAGIPFQTDLPGGESRGSSAATVPAISRLGSANQDLISGSQYGSRAGSAISAVSGFGSSALPPGSQHGSRTGSALPPGSQLGSRTGSALPPGSQHGSRSGSATSAKSEAGSIRPSATSARSKLESRAGSSISAKSEAGSRVASATSVGSRVSSAGSVFHPSAEGSRLGSAVGSRPASTVSGSPVPVNSTTPTGQGATITSESPAPLPIFGYQNSGFIEDELDRF